GRTVPARPGEVAGLPLPPLAATDAAHVGPDGAVAGPLAVVPVAPARAPVAATDAAGVGPDVAVAGPLAVVPGALRSAVTAAGVRVPARRIADVVGVRAGAAAAVPLSAQRRRAAVGAHAVPGRRVADEGRLAPAAAGRRRTMPASLAVPAAVAGPAVG